MNLTDNSKTRLEDKEKIEPKNKLTLTSSTYKYRPMTSENKKNMKKDRKKSWTKKNKEINKFMMNIKEKNKRKKEKKSLTKC